MPQNPEEDQISEAALAELRKIARKEFGKRLSGQDIEEIGIRLLRLLSITEQWPGEAQSGCSNTD
jgi:hypothetical protein